MARYFMHTIEGKAATFSRRDGQIVFVDVLPHWQDKPNHALLRASVAEIERDQRVTQRNRASWKLKDPAGKYGYVIVDLPRSR